MRNRLLVAFAIALAANRYAVPKSRFKLYQEWAELTVRTACQRKQSEISSGEWLALHRETGLDLVRNLALSIGLPKLSNTETAPFQESLAIGMLIPSAEAGKVKFFHESMNEFFVAWGLLDSFRKVAKGSAGILDADKLPLAQVDLDFLQTSLYGFLWEELGSGYLEEMRGAFQNSGFALSSPRKLIRNLVECAGMICEGGDDEDHVEWLLGIMGDRRLDDVTRYNAARALERSHPWAPRPYFDYMSDWGDRDWKEVRTRAATDKISPWAVRGYRIREAAGAESEEVFHRNPRVFPYMAVCKGDKIRPLLQARVSETVGNLLLDLLHQLPESPERQNEETYRPIDLLLINFSHAWVRWYHSEHSPLLRDVRNSATKNQACKETQENLETWVDHGALRYS